MDIRLKKSDLENRSNTQVARVLVEDESGRVAVFFVCVGMLSSSRPVLEVSNLPKSSNSRAIRKTVCGVFK